MLPLKGFLLISDLKIKEGYYLFLEKLLQPAISFMNKLPFKVKIIVSISALFLLLILPSRVTFVDFIAKNETHKNQLVGLSYNEIIHELIQKIQLHRGLSNAYLHGSTSYKENILKSEKQIEEWIGILLKFDEGHFKMLKHNKDFTTALSSLELLRLKNFKGKRTYHDIFKMHSSIIAELINTFDEVASISSFSNSDDKRVNYIAQMLQEKLLLLEENSGQIRGLAAGIFKDKKISKEQKSKLLSLYTLIKSLEAQLLDNQALLKMDGYLDIQKKTTFVSYKLQEILATINKNIIMIETPNYDSKLFFKEATFAMREQSKLYKMLSNNYKILIKELHKKMLVDFTLVLAGFLLILLFSIYIFAAFYHSIAKSLKKLQTASRMIAEGKTNIHLHSETNDEIGDALMAFNDMSKKLTHNISFLDGYKMAIDETSIVSKSNPKGIITYVNKKFCDISGYSKQELIGHSHNIVRHPDMPKEAFKDLWKTIKSKKIWKGVVKNKTKDGGYYMVDATIIPVVDAHGEVIEYIGVRHDVTELEKSKEEIKKQKIDILTGLENRGQLLDDLKLMKKPILLYLNIDDFSKLNDFYGAGMGDNVLVHLAELLKEIAINSGCKVYKLYADEFIFLFEEGKLNRKNYHDILSEIINYIEIKTLECDAKSCVSLTLSAGVAFYSDSEDHVDLVPNASMARKVAKLENKKFLLYSDTMRKDDDYANNIKWINKIKEALNEDRLTTFFQPIIDNKTGAITKYESLVRMIDIDGKVISPFFFLDIAKKAKLYTNITKIVIDKTFATFEKFPQYEFSMNITVEDIYDKEISAYIFEKLSEFPHPEKVIFEITESEEIKDYEGVNKFIAKIKSFDSKIAIDDFGSGYANFEHIISLNADFIKIDGSLIKNIDTSEDSRIIIEAIIAFSKKLGSKTVVEYVHNEAVYEKVKDMGADFSQGFYLGEPAAELVSVKELISLHEEI